MFCHILSAIVRKGCKYGYPSARNGEVLSVVVRLGNFHLMMSFMGYLMGGSGLKELWSIIYAFESIEKMLNGHA